MLSSGETSLESQGWPQATDLGRTRDNADHSPHFMLSGKRKAVAFLAHDLSGTSRKLIVSCYCEVIREQGPLLLENDDGAF